MTYSTPGYSPLTVIKDGEAEVVEDDEGDADDDDVLSTVPTPVR